MDRFKGITGIYKITNLTNNKFYIGQSRNIELRWKQHTYKAIEDAYPKSRLRSAFKKYGLHKTVMKQGVFNNFKFEIIEECNEEDLLIKEKEYIEKLKPEYNCNILTPSNFYKGNHRNKEKKIWLQYHNHEAEGGYPANDILLYNNEISIFDSTHYISSRKRSILYSQGDIIFLIVGRIFNKKKFYFLWTKTLVEEIDFIENDDLIYNAIGSQNYIYLPQLLNDKNDFNEFFRKTGHFGLGFLNITNLNFTKTLEDLANKYLCIKDVSFKEYINEFEKTYDGDV